MKPLFAPILLYEFANFAFVNLIVNIFTSNSQIHHDINAVFLLISLAGSKMVRLESLRDVMAMIELEATMQERILLVDDQEDVRDYLYYALVALQKYDVLIAENGADALKIVENEHIDLIVTDQQMPEMTGLEMLHILQQRGMQVPSILATGQGSEETAVSAFRLGVLDYLVKPVDPDELEASVEKALRTTRLEQERVELIDELIENNADLQQRAREFNVLYGVGQTVNAHNELATVFHRVVDSAVFAVEAEEGGLVLWDVENSVFCVHTIKEKGADARTVRQSVEDILVERAFRTGQPVLVEKKPEPTFGEYGVSMSKSSLHVPIFSYGQPIGVLYVTNSKTMVPINYTDTQMLAALADYVALAIHQADSRDRIETEAEADMEQDHQALEDEIGNITS